MKSRFSVEVCVIVIGASSLTCCHPPTPRIAKVEVALCPIVTTPDATMKDIFVANDRAKEAIREKDPDGLLIIFIQDGYNSAAGLPPSLPVEYLHLSASPS
ncbi:MAG: hypothetical protein ACT4OL_07505 [Nitrospiraceae bacterium]